MASKIGVVLALDGESKFTQAMKNAQQATKLLDASLKELKTEYKGSADSAEFLTKQQELLKQKEEAYQRTLTAAKTGQSNAKRAYKEQAEALKELEQQLEQAQSALSRMGKEDPGYSKQAKEVERLASAVDKQTTNYLRAEGRLTSWDNKVTKAESDIRKNSNALEKNAADMNKGSSEAGKLANSMDDVGKEAEDTSKSIKEVGVSLGTMAKAKAVDIAGDALRELGQKAVEAAKYAVEVGSEFEASMSEVQAISGAAGGDLESLSDKAKQLGRTTKFSASEVASAYKYMGMAGWDAGQMLSGVEGILNLAAASGEELGTTSDIVTDDLTAFGMSAEEAGRMADVLAAASTNSNTNVSMLGETFKYAGAVAGSFGYSLEDVSVAAGLMANAGIKGSQAGTALRSIFTRLATDAGASANKLGALGVLTEELGVQFYETDGTMRPFKNVLVDLRKAWNGLTQEQQTNYANTIAGKNAISGFLSLMNAEEADFVKLSSAIEDSNGAAEKMADIMQDNLQGAVTKMQSAAEGLGIAVYDKVKGPLTGLADLAASAMGAMTERLTPERTEMDSFFDEIESHSTAAASSFEAAQNTINSAVGDIGQLEHYRTVIVDLNGKEELNELQKYQLKAAVDALKGSIPELAAAYDETTGKINLETDAINDLIEAQQNQILETAKQQAGQELLTGLFEANLAKEQAKAAKEAEEGTVKSLQEQKNAFVSSLDDMVAAYRDLTYGRADLDTLGEGMASLQAQCDSLGISMDDLADYAEGKSVKAINEFDNKIAEAEKNVAKASKELDAADKAVKENEDALRDFNAYADTAVETTKSSAKAITEETLAMQDNTDASDENAKSQQERQKAARDLRNEETESNRITKQWLTEEAKAFAEGRTSLEDLGAAYRKSAEETKNLDEKYMNLNDTYGVLKEAAEGYAQAQKDASTFEGVDEDRYEKAIHDMTHFKYIWDQHGESIKDSDKVLADYVDKIMDAKDAWSKSADKTKELEALWKDNLPSLGESLVSIGQRISEDLIPEETKEKIKDKAADLGEGLAEGIKEWGAKAKEEAARLAEEWARSLEEASTRSADAIRNGWQTLQDNAKQTLTISIESEFDGGADLTTEKMNENLESQLEGYRDYVKNLEVLREAVAQGIITPEFFTHLEEQGTSAANEIQHMAWTLENQENGVEQVQGISDKWTEALNMQDEISRIIAGDQAALAGALASFGSSDADFSALTDAIDTGLAGADADLQAKIQNLVQTAQNVGATIPDGLAESIESGEVDASGIEEQLNAAITGAIEGLADVAKESGAVVPDGLVDGIADGTGDVQAAYDTLISSIATSAASSGAIESAAQAAFTTPLAQGITANQAEVVTAAQQTGEQAAAGFTSGVSSGQGDAVAAAQTLASTAASAMSGGDWTSIGYNMAAGVASGIAAGQSLAVNAAVNMMRNALAGAKREGQIASPSKKFANIIGKNMAAGTAAGLKDGTKLAVAASKDMASRTLAETAKWIKKRRKLGGNAKENERYFWAQMVALTQQGSDQYNKLLNKAENVATKQRFGVKWTKKNSKGKVTKKDAETYFSEVYSAAQEYFEMLTMNQDMSTRDELTYWTKVQARLRKGTKAYTDAAQKIKSIKEKMGGFDVASDLLDSFQVYHEMSERAEMEYWDTIRKNYAVGTEDRLKADEKYLSAKKSLTEKLKDLEDDYNDKVAETNQKYTDALKERTEAIAEAFDIFSAFESESATGEELLFNMRSQAEGYKFWADQLAQLQNRGILSQDLMDVLGEKGPEDTAALYALNQLTNEQLIEYNKAYQEKMDLSRKQAEKDTKSVQQTVQSELAALKSEYNKNVASVNSSMASELKAHAENIKTIADDEVIKIVNAINGQMASNAGSGGGTTTAGGGSAGTAAPAASSGTGTAAASADTSSVKKNQVKNIVKKGKKASKTNKNYSDLRNHIISKYGYDVGDYKDNAITQELGKLFGVTVSKTSTAAQRTKLLNAMKKAGLRSGSRRVSGVPVWMDEGGLGSELVLSRSDNAVLTRIPAGSAVAPANLTNNLWQWGAVAPAQFLASIQRQQASMTDYVNRMAMSVNVAALNRQLVTSQAVPVQGSSSGTGGEVLVRVLDLLSEYLPEISRNRDMYLDGRKVTGTLSDPISEELAMRSRRRRR